MALGFAALALVAGSWFSLDRRPPEWDYANHLEEAVRCAQGLRMGDWDAVLGHSAFYPPLVPCAAGLVYLMVPTDVAAAAVVLVASLGLGMLATYLAGPSLRGRDRCCRWPLSSTVPRRSWCSRRFTSSSTCP